MDELLDKYLNKEEKEEFLSIIKPIFELKVKNLNLDLQINILTMIV